MSTSNPFVDHDDEHWFAPPPAWWAMTLAAFDGVVANLMRLNAPLGMRVLDRAGRLAHAMHLVPPTAEAVCLLFPEMPADQAVAVARASAGLRFRNRAAIALLQRRGVGALAGLVEAPGSRLAALAASPGGAILLAFHVGAQFGVGATLSRLGRRTLTLRDMPIQDAHDRARALKEAVDAVKAGTVIIAAVDGPGGVSTGPVACLGRRIVLRRGPFVLARLSGVPLVPVVAQWTPSGHIVSEAGAPLDAGAVAHPSRREDLLTSAAAGWLERHLRAHPEDLWPYTLANLVQTPRTSTDV